MSGVFLALFKVLSNFINLFSIGVSFKIQFRSILRAAHTFKTYCMKHVSQCMQHICSSVHIKEIYFSQFVVIFLFESTLLKENTTRMCECYSTFLHATQLMNFMKYISRNICFLFHSVHCSIEIYWFLASYKCFIFQAIYFIGVRCALMYY